MSYEMYSYSGMVDAHLAKGIKSLLTEDGPLKLTQDELKLLPAQVWLGLASLIRAAEYDGILHGHTSMKIIRQSMIEAILDKEYPDEVTPL